jgi:hypothetical protein
MALGIAFNEKLQILRERDEGGQIILTDEMKAVKPP